MRDPLSVVDLLHKLHDDIANMPTRTEPIGGQLFRYVQLDEVLGWVDLALAVAIEPVTNTSAAAHCPRCAICHTHDETCGQAVRRFFERNRFGPVVVVVGDAGTDAIDLPCEAWPADAPEPFELLKEVEALRAQVLTLEDEAGTWQNGFAKGRRAGTKTALAERNHLRRQLGAALEQLGKQP